MLVLWVHYMLVQNRVALLRLKKKHREIQWQKGQGTHYPDADLVVRESGGLEVFPKDNLVMIGIKHSGDENGLATYCQGYIVIS